MKNTSKKKERRTHKKRKTNRGFLLIEFRLQLKEPKEYI